MVPIRNIAVAVDNSSSDEHIIKTLKYLSENFFQLVEVHLVYVEHISEFDRRYIHENYAFEKANEDFKSELRQKLTVQFNDAFGDKAGSIYLNVDVLEGSPIAEFISFCEDKDFDMLVVGKKHTNRISRFAKLLLRRTDLPVIVIPDNISEDWRLNKVLVPYDFSDNSDVALNTALAFKGDNDAISIDCFNGVDIPTYNSEIIVSYKEITDSLLEAKKSAFANKLKELEVNYPVKFSCELKLNRPMGKEIINKVKEGHFDMVIMGAKGHSRIEKFFIGSVAEKVLNSHFSIPVFIVR